VASSLIARISLSPRQAARPAIVFIAATGVVAANVRQAESKTAFPLTLRMHRRIKEGV